MHMYTVHHGYCLRVALLSLCVHVLPVAIYIGGQQLSEYIDCNLKRCI